MLQLRDDVVIFLDAAGSIEPHPDLRCAHITFEVVAELAAHLLDDYRFRLVLERQFQMAQHGVLQQVYGSGLVDVRFQISLDIAENPGLPQSATPDHDRITLGLLIDLGGFFR